MMNSMISAAANNDADLVNATLAGDRDAFGKIVARYQSLICSLAYSATGSLGHSEDLAQETFLTAWRQLANLREREKLRAWLCGIARNLINNLLRKQGREPSHRAETLEEISGSFAPEPLPVEHTISNEEQAILWRSLKKIPEAYREPLVLFYRENQSVEAVAEKLELNADAVHQRLSRGRKLLAQEVTAFVEGALARTNPGAVFTFSVLAALPITFSTSAKAATFAAAAAKGGATATGATFMSILSVLIGPLVGLIGGYIGIKSSLNSTRTQRERSLMKKYIATICAAVVVFIAALLLFMRFAMPLWNHYPKLFIALGLGITAAYGIFIFFSATRFNRIFTRTRDEEWQLHPELFHGDDRGARCWNPWEYRSRATLLGLPLVHCRFGKLPGQKLQPAVGWIACGEKAYGILYASGVVAIGGISVGATSIGIFSFGGFSIGLLAFGGMSLGAIAFGGAAIGWIASGGFAIAWHAAFGGVAAAHELALGGAALANHANDEVAREFFLRHPWFNIGRATTRNVFWLLCFLPMILQFLSMAFWRRKMAKGIR